MRRAGPATTISALVALIGLTTGSVDASAQGVTRYVATAGTDGGACDSPSAPCATVAYALSQSAAGDTLSVGAGTYTEDIIVTDSVSIVGAGAALTVLDGGRSSSTVWVAPSAGIVAMSNLTVRDGDAQYGGGIRDDGQSLTLTAVDVTGNAAQPQSNEPNGAPVAGAGIDVSTGSLSLVNSTVSGNVAAGGGGSPGTGGGVSGGDGGSALGAGVYALGSALSLAHSTVSNNKAQGGVGGVGGAFTGGVHSGGIGGGGGSGGIAEGGGIYNASGSLTVAHSTISGNSASDGDGGAGGVADAGTGGTGGANDPSAGTGKVAGGAGIFTGGGVDLTASKVTGNVAKGGTSGQGGVGIEGDVGGGSGPAGQCSYLGIHGGGISAVGGTVAITSSTITGNRVDGCSGGVGGSGHHGGTGYQGSGGGPGGLAGPAWGGGLDADGAGSITIAASTLSGNAANGGRGGDGGNGGGGGPVNSGDGTGGGYAGGAGPSGPAYGGAVAWESGLLGITTSTLAGNVASGGRAGSGGKGGAGGAAELPAGFGGNGGGGGNANAGNSQGGSAHGGAIYQLWGNGNPPASWLANDTVVGNSAAGGAGGSGGPGGSGGAGVNAPGGSNGGSGTGSNGGSVEAGGLWLQSGLLAANDTITENAAVAGARGVGGAPVAGAADGGGLYAPYNQLPTLQNTIVAQNTASSPDLGSTNGPDCAGAVTSHRGNLIGDGDGCAGPSSGGGDQVGAGGALLDPQLGGLAMNGGSTDTMAPHPGSPAIGRAIAAACQATPVDDLDQRGYPRQSAVLGACDVGAYDTAEPARFQVGVPASATAGQSFTVTVTAVDAFGSADAGYAGTVSFAASDKAAVLPIAYRFRLSDAGTHTFTVTLNTAGGQRITVRDKHTKLIAGSSATISVT